MRRTARFPIVAATVVAAFLSATAATAFAQSASPVGAGSEVSVANNGECLPNTDVALFFEGAGVAETRVGSAVSDAAGSFEATVVIPAEAAGGAAAILVDCGLDSAVLTYDLEVVGSGFSLKSLVGPVFVGLAVIAVIALVASLRRRMRSGRGEAPDGTDVHQDAGAQDTGDQATADQDTADDLEAAPIDLGDHAVPMPPVPAGAAGAVPGAPGLEGAGDVDTVEAIPPELAAPPASMPPAPPVAPAPAQEGDHDHDEGVADDGADYWFWEAATSAGPRRRVACMTETTFHLHEVSVDAFQPMLDRLVEVGPDEALAQAFVRIPVAAVDRVVREGTVVHIEGRSAAGPRRQTIDLADGADGVVEMLARRLPVVDGSRVQESVR